MAGIVLSKVAGLADSIYGKSETPIKMFLEENVKAYEDRSFIKDVFVEMDSDNFAEKFGSMTGLAQGFIPVGEGGAYPLDEKQEGYSKVIEPLTWKNSFAITKEMMEDNKILDLNKTGARGFLKNYFLTKEKFAAQLLIGAVTGTSTTFRGATLNCTTADGVSIFATNHPSKTGNTAVQSNKFAGAFSVDVLGQIETKMQNFTDDNGEILAVSPDIIMIPNYAALKKAVFGGLGADKDPLTANNGFNYQYGRWTIIVNPYLNPLIGSDSPFFVMDSNYNKEYLGLIMLTRIPLTVDSWVDNNNDNCVWKGRTRFTVGANDWREIAVGGIAGATALS
jgi:hypothetical protein